MKKTLLLSLLLLSFRDASSAHPGWGLVKDSRGNIFFCDVNRNIIWKIDTRGKVSRFIVGKHSHQIFIDELDNLYGHHIEYDSQNDRWLGHRWKATPAGKMSLADEKSTDPFFIPVDRRGNQYFFVSDTHKKIAYVARETSLGDSVLFASGTWGDRDGRGINAQFRTFGSFVMGPDGILYLASGGIIRKLALDGTVTTLAGRRDGFGDPDEPRASGFLGVALDHERNVYAANWEKRVVIKITPDGNVMTILDSGMLWSPSGVLVVENDIYVLEHRAGVTGLLEKAGLGGPRVRKLSADGTIRIVGMVP